MATLQMKIDHVHAEFVSGNAVSSTVSTHSVVSRDGSGNVHANKFKSANMELTHNVPTSARTSDSVFYSSVDDVIRKNTASGFRTSLNVPTRTGGGASGTWGISITGNAATASQVNNSLTPGSYLTGSAFNGSTARTFAVDATEAATASKIVARNSSGDINCRLVRPNYQNQSTISGGIAYRVSTTDNYIRFCTNMGAVRSHIGCAAVAGSTSQNFSSQECYVQNWVRTKGNAGHYWESSSNGNGWHIYPKDRADMYLRTGAGNGGICGTIGNATARGYIHWTTGNEIGFLTNARAWSLRMDSNKNCHIYGNLETDGRHYADNGVHVRGDWLRVNGNNGLYFESHGGGWFMQDTTWVRVYNGKSLWCGNGIMGTNYRCGIGTSSPDERLHVYNNSTTARAIIERDTNSGECNLTLKGYHSSGSTEWQIYHSGSTAHLYFWRGGNRGYLQYAGSNYVLNFTGQHRTFIKDIPFTQAPDLEGLIVSADQNKYIKMSGGIEAGSNAITTNESLPVVTISTKANDKKCFGVISASEDPETREEAFGNFVSVSQKEYGDTRVFINSVGEGAIWVTNINGNLESGDYITTSNVTGYGMLQDDDILHNYTVAKITMDCDFEPVTQPVQQIVKELSNVNYWVKTTYRDVALERYSNLTEENRQTITTTRYSNEEGEISPGEYSNLESNVQATYSEIETTAYQQIERTESKTEKEGYTLEVREELVNVLDEHGQLQWEDHPTDTEKAYKIRYLTSDGQITDEANAVHIAAFVGCTYHCG